MPDYEWLLPLGGRTYETRRRGRQTARLILSGANMEYLGGTCNGFRVHSTLVFDVRAATAAMSGPEDEEFVVAEILRLLAAMDHECRAGRCKHTFDWRPIIDRPESRLMYGSLTTDQLDRVSVNVDSYAGTRTSPEFCFFMRYSEHPGPFGELIASTWSLRFKGRCVFERIIARQQVRRRLMRALFDATGLPVDLVVAIVGYSAFGVSEKASRYFFLTQADTFSPYEKLIGAPGTP